MKAWIMTWESVNQKIKDENRLLALLSSRKSEKYVSELVEFIYLRATSSAADMLFFANRSKCIPYNADRKKIINDVPHGDRITCGHNPFIYARKVSCVKVTNGSGGDNEEITWKEPPIFKWKDENIINTEVCSKGEIKVLKRMRSLPLSNDLRHFNV